MPAIQQLLMAMKSASGGGASAATWNPSDKSANITLSGGNLVATQSATSGGMVRATDGQTTGKYYFEILIGSGGTPSNGYCGIANGSASTANLVGAANSWGYRGSGSKAGNGGGDTGFGSSYVAGDVIGIAFDVGAGLVWFAKNNAWQASGNPSAGTNAAFSGITGTLYAAYSGNTSGNNGTVRFSSSSWTYSAPSGFTNIP